MSSKKTPANTNGEYRLEVADFGPIASASVALRPLTVFVGPSNTGKSYLAILLYALHRGLVRALGTARRPHTRFLWGPPSRSAVPALVRSGLDSWISAGDPRLPLPEDVERAVRSNANQDGKRVVPVFDEVSRCFGVDDLELLVRRNGKRKSAEVRLLAPWPGSASQMTLRLGRGRETPTVRVSESAPIPADEAMTARGLIDPVSRSRLHQSLFSQLSLSLVRQGFRPSLRDAYYLPADRTGVMHSHNVVVSNLVQNAAVAGIRPGFGDTPILSGVLADFLTRLIEIGRPQRVIRRTARYGDQLESRLLDGRVVVKTTPTGYPSFTYQPENWTDEDLPLMRSSSMVSELAPVILFLRYRTRPGDVLIIEEPEAHLHPAKQAALARELVRVVRIGVRIVITTHSEWLMEQIGNLLQLSALPEERRTGIPNSDVALSAREVGVWLFRKEQGARGSVVEEVRIDPESGLFPTDYDLVSEALYNQNAAIFNRKQEG